MWAHNIRRRALGEGLFLRLVPFISCPVVVVPREPHALTDSLRWNHVGLVHFKLVTDNFGQNILALRGQADARFFYFFAVCFFVPTHNENNVSE